MLSRGGYAGNSPEPDYSLAARRSKPTRLAKLTGICVAGEGPSGRRLRGEVIRQNGAGTRNATKRC